jgi:hypothetical protein
MPLRDWRLIVLETYKSEVAANSKDLTTPCGVIKDEVSKLHRT